MLTLKHLAAALAFTASLVSADDEMGPAAFMWPEDRVWSGAMDNTAPCGSVASAGNRTDFPLVNGKIALVAQDGSFNIQLAVSHEKDPKLNSDFETIIDAESFAKLDPGHTCINIPNAPQSARAGDIATLQIKYISDFDKPENQTFYACADITYVEIAEFKIQIPCFNATEPDDGEKGPQEGPNHDDWDLGDDDEKKDGQNTGNKGDPIQTDGSLSSDTDNNNGSGTKKLSGGAIAGIVVGSVAGVGLIAAAGLSIYRRKQQRLSALRQKHSARGVSWDNEQRVKDSVSTSSVRMQNLPAGQ